MANDIVRKLEKILRLAESENAFEAANAASKAQAIADKYNIAIEILKEKGCSSEDRIIDYQKSTGDYIEAPLPWEQILSKVVSEKYGCRVFMVPVRGGPPVLNIAGKYQDIEIFKMMYFWLRHQVQILILKEYDKSPLWLEAFTLGAIHKINRKMKESSDSTKREMLKTVSGAAFAISKIDNKLNEVDKFLAANSRFEKRSVPVPKAGFNEGYQAARKISVHRSKQINPR